MQITKPVTKTIIDFTNQHAMDRTFNEWMNLVSSFYDQRDCYSHYIKPQEDRKYTVEVEFGQSGCQRVIKQKGSEWFLVKKGVHKCGGIFGSRTESCSS